MWNQTWRIRKRGEVLVYVITIGVEPVSIWWTTVYGFTNVCCTTSLHFAEYPIVSCTSRKVLQRSPSDRYLWTDRYPRTNRYLSTDSVVDKTFETTWNLNTSSSNPLQSCKNHSAVSWNNVWTERIDVTMKSCGPNNDNNSHQLKITISRVSPAQVWGAPKNIFSLGFQRVNTALQFIRNCHSTVTNLWFNSNSLSQIMGPKWCEIPYCKQD